MHECVNLISSEKSAALCFLFLIYKKSQLTNGGVGWSSVF